MKKNCNNNKFINPDYYSVVVVQDLNERNTIPCKLRQNGMVAVVVENNYAQYQLQTSMELGPCDNSAWVLIATGEEKFDGGNLFIFYTTEELQMYLDSNTPKIGQMIYLDYVGGYFRYGGLGTLIDPFPKKLDKPVETASESDTLKIPMYDLDSNPFWVQASTLGKVATVNNIQPDENKNVTLKISDLLNDKDYIARPEYDVERLVVNSRLTELEGLNFVWTPSSRILKINDASNQPLTEISLLSLDNEGTDFRYNTTTKALELWNDQDELIDSIPILEFVGNVASQLSLSTNTLQLKDSQGQVLSSVTFAVSNVGGLQAALDLKENKLPAGTTTQYLRGDKTMQTLNKAAVGLSNVDNTTDALKPVSTPQLTALNLKLDKPTTTITDTASKWAVLVDSLGDSFKVLAGDLGKNIANSKLVSVLNAGLDLGANWTLDTKGYLYKILGLSNKSADATYDLLLGTDVSGNIAKVSGFTAFNKAMAAATDLQKDAWRMASRKSNESYSIGQPIIDAVTPPIVANNTTAVQYIVLVGTNLFVDNVTPTASVSMINKVTGVIYPITNYTVLQTFPNIISFGNNMSQYPTGEYYFRVVHNGVESLPNQISTLKVVSALILQPLPPLTWDVFEVNPANKVTPPSLFSTGISFINDDYPTTVAEAYTASFKTNESLVTLAEIDNGGVAIVLDITYKSSVAYRYPQGAEIVVSLIAATFENNTSITGDMRINYSPRRVSYSPSSKAFEHSSESINDKVWIIIKNRTTLLVYFQNRGFASLETVYITSDLALKLINPIGFRGNWGYQKSSISVSFDKKILLN